MLVIKSSYFRGWRGCAFNHLCFKKMNAQQIYLSNRTKEKAQILKNLFEGIEVIDWGALPDFDMIINATSLGLRKMINLELIFQIVEIINYFLMLFTIHSILIFGSWKQITKYIREWFKYVLISSSKSI